MSRIAPLALVSLLVASAASAQATYPSYPQQQYPASNYQQASPVQYDTARIVSVVPVAGSGYAQGQNCYSSQGGYVQQDPYNNGYNNGYNGGYGYNGGGYPQSSGNGRAIAGVVGSLLGAALGSQMGGGSGKYITSTFGSSMGQLAGQAVYENVQRQKRRGVVTVCDPVPNGAYNGGATQYDVTYLYNGRTFTTRLPYRPQGDTLQIQVNVQPR